MGLLRPVFSRVVALVPVVLGITVLVFALNAVALGDPARVAMGQRADAAALERLRREYALDRSLPVQYAAWLGRLARGDLGESFREQRPVGEVIVERLPATARLALAATLISIVLGVGIGAVAAVRAGSALDHLLMGVAVLGISTPVFWLGLMLQLVVAVRLGWLPVSGYGDGTLTHLILPAFALGALHTGTVARMTRSSLLEVVRQDFMATARAKGLSEWAVLGKHALRNAAVPVVTVVGIGLADLLVGAPLTETVFAWPGVGRLLVADVGQRDVPVVMGAVLVFALVVVLGCAIGLLAGYFGGPVDAALMRVTDVVMAFPSLVLAIGLIAVFERPGLDKVFIVLVALGWTTIARVVRGEVLSLKARDFVQAARALGGGHRAIMLRHLLPNAVAPLLVAATIGVGGRGGSPAPSSVAWASAAAAGPRRPPERRGSWRAWGQACTAAARS